MKEQESSLIRFIDSHAHLTCESVYPLVHEMLQRAQAKGLSHVINICTDVDSLEKGLQLAKQYPFVHNAAATTPHDVEKEGAEVFHIMEQAAVNGSLLAVGETGLDYYYEHSAKSLQQDFLRQYLRLAKKCKLPVIIHCRDAFDDFFRILDEEYTENGVHLPGVLHCFTGNKEEALEVVARGWYVSFSGIVTFKKSAELREIATKVPLELVLVETDTPYLAPQTFRGKVNEPGYLIETIKVVASCQGVSAEKLAKLSSENAQKLFQI